MRQRGRRHPQRRTSPQNKLGVMQPILSFVRPATPALRHGRPRHRPGLFFRRCSSKVKSRKARLELNARVIESGFGSYAAPCGRTNMKVSKRTVVAGLAAIPTGLVVGGERLASAQSQGDVIGELASNEGIFVDGKTFKIARGKAKGDASAQIARLGAKEVGPGAIIPIPRQALHGGGHAPGAVGVPRRHPSGDYGYYL
jgi:hypothetical protein